MILVKKAITGLALIGLGYMIGKSAMESRMQDDYYLVPKSSYCLQLDIPLSEYFSQNFTDKMKPSEIYTALEMTAKECGK